MTELGDLMTRAELAVLARVDRRTLERWAARGIGPRPIRHGPRLIRYRRSEAEGWLAEGDGPGHPPPAAHDGPDAA
jgi:predicted DNA-binding transcriptional regulator AlpA